MMDLSPHLPPILIFNHLAQCCVGIFSFIRSCTYFLFSAFCGTSKKISRLSTQKGPVPCVWRQMAQAVRMTNPQQSCLPKIEADGQGDKDLSKVQRIKALEALSEPPTKEKLLDSQVSQMNVHRSRTMDGALLGPVRQELSKTVWKCRHNFNGYVKK